MFLFTAIDFDNQIKGKLRKITERLAGRSSAGNFTPRDNFHLTLVFLGETDEKRVPLISGVIDSIKTKPFAIELGGLGRLKIEGGDILWCGVRLCTELRELNSRLSEGLRGAGFDIESRSYRPHITLGRGVLLAPGFDQAEFDNSLPRLTAAVDRISLMKSDRAPGAVKYAEIYGKPLS